MSELISKNFRRLILGISRRILRPMGYSIAPTALPYFDADAVIDKATKAGLPVGEYLEVTNLGSVGKRRDLIVELINGVHLPAGTHTVLEIGSGTCMFLEKLVGVDGASSVEIYEPNLKWRSYGKRLISELGVNVSAPDADGRSLKQTPNRSVDKVYAHGVFVYTPVVKTLGYFKEASRVLKKGGFFVFDVFLARSNFSEIIDKFQRSNPDGFDFPVFLDEAWLRAFAESCGFEVTNSFDAPYHGITTTYFVLRRL